jgi:hypothetical protein
MCKEKSVSEKRLSEVEIRRRLHGIIDYHLFQAPSWPADGNACKALYALAEQMGLYRPVSKNSEKITALGKRCDADLADYFVGAREPTEIPFMLRLKDLLTDDETDAFYRTLDTSNEPDIWARVEPLVFRAYRRWRQAEALKALVN